MPRTKKVILPKNLLEYEVYEEDRSINSDYFNVINLPQVFTGGRNSFFLDGSDFLKNGSSILVEILDVNGNPVYHIPKIDYLEGTAILVTVEIYDTTPVGNGTLVLMGEIDQTTDGQEIPDEWKDTYNLRWVKNVMINPGVYNKSPIRFVNEPKLTVSEKQFYTIISSSFFTQSLKFTASLSPIYESSEQVGYLIKAESPTIFSIDLLGGIITGSVRLSSSFANTIETASINLYVDDILNETTSFATNASIITNKNTILQNITLRSGSYLSSVFSPSSNNDAVSASVEWIYNRLITSGTNIPISFADIRLTDLATVSGEIYKTRIYAKPATMTGEYKLIADIPPSVTELLVTESRLGYIPIGDFNLYPSASTAWYADELTSSLQENKITYPISGTRQYYESSISAGKFNVFVSDKILLDSMNAYVPVDIAQQKFSGSVSQSGYFIGTKKPILLTPTTEYTLQLNAYYKKISGSINLVGNTPKVDIYLVGESGTTLVSDNPLGQLVGHLIVPENSLHKRFQNQQFNFTPTIVNQGLVGLRFVVSNGFWQFSDISILPATDPLFSPDEVRMLVPNTEFYNQYLQYKVEFFDINNNSTPVSSVSPAAYFTGSSIDLGYNP